MAAETVLLPPATSADQMTVDEVFRSLEPKKPKGGLPAGLGLLALGLVAMFVVLAPLGGLAGIVKIPLFLAAAYLTIKGVDVIGKTLRGPRFETGLWLCSAWLALLAFAAIFADFLPFAEHVDTVKSITEPGNARPDFFSKHPLGSNNFSLDLLGQSVYAARVSVGTALLAVAIAIVLGTVLGMMAGYFRSWFDVVFGIYVDSIMSVPALLLLIAVITVIGKPEKPFEAVWKMGLTLAIVAVPTMSRWRIMFREIMPNVALPVLSYSFIIIATLIVAEGSLSFLGIGLKQPDPTWGNMIAEGRVSNVLRKYPHIALVPGVFMFLTVYSFNMVGEKFRSLWDARDSKL